LSRGNNIGYRYLCNIQWTCGKSLWNSRKGKNDTTWWQVSAWRRYIIIVSCLSFFFFVFVILHYSYRKNRAITHPQNLIVYLCILTALKRFEIKWLSFNVFTVRTFRFIFVIVLKYINNFIILAVCVCTHRQKRNLMCCLLELGWENIFCNFLFIISCQL